MQTQLTCDFFLCTIIMLTAAFENYLGATSVIVMAKELIWWLDEVSLDLIFDVVPLFRPESSKKPGGVS